MNKKIRVGVVGASPTLGWACRSHLPALQNNPDFELTAVCTTNPDSARASAEKYGARLAFHDYRTLAASPEVDVIAVVVRVPNHYAVTHAALEGGKHVYTEWPLGKTTAEAKELAALAKSKGRRAMVGLQARFVPALMHMKELVAAGYVGEVLACQVSLTRPGILERDSTRTWQRDAELGANTLTIPNGHTLDALRFVAGEFQQVSAMVGTQTKRWLETDTRKMLDATAPDNVSLSGRLANGAMVSSYISTIPWAGNGYRMDIYGDKGTLSATSAESPQLQHVKLYGAQRGNELRELDVPARFAYVDSGYPHPVYNVAQQYSQFARVLRDEPCGYPSFETAVELHRFIDAIRESSETGRAVRWP